MKNGMQYEELQSTKASEFALRKHLKVTKERNINSMSSGAILLFLVNRHRLELLTASNVITAVVLFWRW